MMKTTKKKLTIAIAIFADVNFEKDVFAINPIADTGFVYSWLYKIVEKQFGKYTHLNLLSFLGQRLAVQRKTDLGYLVNIKGEEFYIPKHKNVRAIPA